MIKEFKDFISNGSLVDIAVAFVLGAAFGSVISSFTEGIVTPLIGRIFSVDGLQDYLIGGDIALGAFIAALLNFVVVGFVMFLVVKAYNRMQAPAAAEDPAADPEDVVLLREIRDSLKK